MTSRETFFFWPFPARLGFASTAEIRQCAAGNAAPSLRIYVFTVCLVNYMSKQTVYTSRTRLSPRPGRRVFVPACGRTTLAASRRGRTTSAGLSPVASRRWSCRLWASSALALSSYLSLTQRAHRPFHFWPKLRSTCDADTQRYRIHTIQPTVCLCTC